MTRVWLLPLVFVAIGAAVAVSQAGSGSVPGAVLFGLLFLALAAAFSPLTFPRHTPAAVAQASGRPVIYWRPGCPYCARLRLSLIGRTRRASWVNIWRDPDGAAAVRAVADGNETVPTVVVDGVAQVNPSPATVRRQLQ